MVCPSRVISIVFAFSVRARLVLRRISPDMLFRFDDRPLILYTYHTSWSIGSFLAVVGDNILRVYYRVLCLYIFVSCGRPSI